MTVNLLQCTFSGGEVSEGVAARVDLPKYQEALLRAKNVFIRPYGGLEKRPGTLFVKKLTPPFAETRRDVSLSPSAAVGQITLTVSQDLFTEIFTLADAGRNMLEADLKVKLRSGVFAVTLSQDTNYYGRVTLRHWAALPFKLSALSREVKFT